MIAPLQLLMLRQQINDGQFRREKNSNVTHSTQTLAHFVAEITPADIPDAVWTATERAVLDTLAALVGGVLTRNAEITRQAARAAFGDGDSPAWFTNEPTLHPLGALLSNCAAASALDIDDGHRAAAGHPGAAIVPAAIMEARRVQATGEELLSAIAIGYDVALRIGEARHMPEDVSFASGIWTGHGVAAVLGRLRGLAPEKIANAIAIAGQEAPRNLPQGACIASSVKGSSPWSTVTAAVAVSRAECGATGSIDLLDLAQAYRQDTICRDLGSRWLITETYHKPYAACRYTNPVIDAIIELSADLPNGEIDALKVAIFPEAERLPNAVVPASLEDAQFSIPFAAALAAISGEIAFRPLLPVHLSDPEVLALSRRVEVEYANEFAGAFPLETPARVSITKGNLTREKLIPIPLGDARRPLSNEEIQRKLFDLGRGHLLEGRLSGLAASISHLRTDGPAKLFRRLTN
jgi:2-methylcitrate dehydratase PrpD